MSKSTLSPSVGDKSILLKHNWSNKYKTIKSFMEAFQKMPEEQIKQKMQKKNRVSITLVLCCIMRQRRRESWRVQTRARVDKPLSFCQRYDGGCRNVNRYRDKLVFKPYLNDNGGSESLCVWDKLISISGWRSHPAARAGGAEWQVLMPLNGFSQMKRLSNFLFNLVRPLWAPASPLGIWPED